jgi:hypothetical protein
MATSGEPSTPPTRRKRLATRRFELLDPQARYGHQATRNQVIAHPAIGVRQISSAYHASVEA